MFIVKIPLISNSENTNGCEKAPNEILDELKNIYSNEQGKIIDFNMIDLEEIHVDNSDLKESNKLIYKNAFEILESKPKAIFLGGDHSVSYSLVRAFLDYCQNSGREPCLIVFDAHADCMSVACSDTPSIQLPNHPPQRNNNKKTQIIRVWLRKLIEEGFPAENILLVGARNLLKGELEFLKKHRIKTITMNQLLEDLQDTCDIIMEFSSNKELYASVDISVIDSAFAPAVACPETCGLSSREFIYLIQRISKMKNLRAVDIVEINPDLDKDNLTIKLGAKILGELI